jgi:hypothetical protein
MIDILEHPHRISIQQDLFCLVNSIQEEKKNVSSCELNILAYQNKYCKIRSPLKQRALAHATHKNEHQSLRKPNYETWEDQNQMHCRGTT